MTTQASLDRLRTRTGRLLAEDLVALGATYRQINYWTSRGHLHVDHAHPGAGHIRTYDPGEGLVVARLLRLLTAGLRFDLAWWIARLDPGIHELAPGVVLTLTDPDDTR